MNAPNVHVCRRCFDKIEWRKKYRKYKPRTQPGKCNLCQKRNVLAAYHTICTACTTSDKARKSIIMTQQEATTSDVMDQSNEVNENSASNENDEVDELARSTGELSVEYNDNDIQSQRVCAMCVKEAALPDEDEGPDTIDDLLARDSRRLKLRERISLERKVLREQEEAKQAAKDARRREREAQADDEMQNHVDCVPLDDVLSDDEDNDVEDACDEEDPFLHAVGGESKLLTGEAYQKMLLERERKELASKS